MSPAPEGGDSPGLPFDLDIAVQDEDWGDIFDDPDSICFRATRSALSAIEAPRLGELSIVFTDDKTIQKLNTDFRGKNTPTNVLSFPGVGPAPLLGDIVIARETVLREADTKNIPAADHVTHLLVHGFLHLQGYDHETDKDAAAMEALEIKALQRLGIDNPYQIEEFSKQS